MADIMNNNIQDVIRDMNNLNKAMEQIGDTTDRDNQSLVGYTTNIKLMNQQMSNFINTLNTSSGKAKGLKFTGLETQVKNVQKNAQALDKASKAHSNTINNILKVMGGSQSIKAVNTVNTLSAGIQELGTAGLAAVNPVVLLTASIAAMGAAGYKAYQNQLKLNRSLISMGANADELTKATTETANKFIESKNKFKDAGQSLGEVFTPLIDVFAELSNSAASFLKDVTGSVSSKNQSSYSVADSKVRWYTSKLSDYGVSELNSLPAISDIAVRSKQSGFDNSSAANLAIGTYDLAIKKAQEFGLESQDVAKQLADAWLTGSDAAKQYGAVVDDTTLIGYMASQGIDIVNVKITDAMKQYYRYQLLVEETTADNNDEMQKNIRSWKQLGYQIDSNKNKLFSFDEVITMQAMDTTIPIVGTPSVSFDGLTHEPTNPIPPNHVNPHDEDKVNNRDRDSESLDKNTESLDENTKALEENIDAIDDLIEGLQELYDELTNIDLSLVETMSEEELATAQAQGDLEILVNDLNSLVNTFNLFLGLFINGKASVEQFQTAMANLDIIMKLLNIDLTSLISTQSSLNNVVQTSVLQFMQLALAADTSKNSILDFVSALEDKISTLQASQSVNQSEINSLRSIASAARSAAQAYRELASAKASASDDNSISAKVGSGKAKVVSLINKAKGLYADASVGVKNTASNISTFVSNTLSSISNSSIGKTVKNTASNIANSNAGKTVQKTGNTIANTSAGLAKGLGASTLDIITGIGNIAKGSNVSNSGANSLKESILGSIFGFTNEMTGGITEGIDNSISNIKNGTSKVKGIASGMTSGITNWLLGKASLGSISVNNSNGQTSISAGAPDWLEVIDLIDSIRESGDIVGSIGSFLGNSITALPNTARNNYDTFKGRGDSTAKALAKALGTAGVWAFEEELDDIMTAGMYANTAVGRADESDAIAKRRLELALAFQQQGWWDDKIAKAVNGAATIEQLESMYSLFSAERPKYNNNSEMLNYYGLATGGIGVKETTARLFENNKKEAVIPLETQTGIDFMSAALEKSLTQMNSNMNTSIEVKNYIDGPVFLDNEDSMNKLASKIRDEISLINVKQGGLDYGTF